MKEIDTMAEFRVVERLSDMKRTDKGVFQEFVVEYILHGGVRRLRVTAVGEGDCNELATHIGDVYTACLDMRSRQGYGNYAGRWFTNIYIKLTSL